MEILRTPDERFAGLDGFNFSPHYSEVIDEQVSPTLLAGLARAVFPDRDPAKNPAAVDFGELDTTIRSIAARAHGHYVALVEEPASHIAPPASQQDQKLP